MLLEADYRPLLFWSHLLPKIRDLTLQEVTVLFSRHSRGSYTTELRETDTAILSLINYGIAEIWNIFKFKSKGCTLLGRFALSLYPAEPVYCFLRGIISHSKTFSNVMYLCVFSVWKWCLLFSWCVGHHLWRHLGTLCWGKCDSSVEFPPVTTPFFLK